MTVIRKDIRLVFPTPIFRYDLAPETAQRIEESFLGAIGEVIDLAGLAPAQQVQTQTDLHRSPRYRLLCDVALDAVRAAGVACGWKDADYVITGLWLNVSTRGHGHRPHTHPNNIFSGVYYVRVGEGANQIAFEDPRAQASMVRMKGDRTTFVYDTFTERVRNGAMVLFPSWLRHFVPASESDEPRISASFNVMVRGFAEDHAGTEWQGNLKLPT